MTPKYGNKGKQNKVNNFFIDNGIFSIWHK